MGQPLIKILFPDLIYSLRFMYFILILLLSQFFFYPKQHLIESIFIK